ncbi:hypothetical protein [Vagococcus jeotgali]|nr:hypothetical protein [Vagococcus sp. B2T-5]
MNETKKYQVIKAVAENKKQKKRASIELNLSKCEPSFWDIFLFD